MSSTNSTSAPVRIASVPGILGNVSTLRQISQARVLCASRSASLDATAVSVSASSSFRLMALRTAASDGNADPNMHNDVSAAAATEKSCLCAFPAASAPPSPWTVLAALAPASAQPNSCATTALADARMAAALARRCERCVTVIVGVVGSEHVVLHSCGKEGPLNFAPRQDLPDTTRRWGGASPDSCARRWKAFLLLAAVAGARRRTEGNLPSTIETTRQSLR